MARYAAPREIFKEEPAAVGTVSDRSVVGDDQRSQEDAEVIDEVAAWFMGLKGLSSECREDLVLFRQRQ